MSGDRYVFGRSAFNQKAGMLEWVRRQAPMQLDFLVGLRMAERDMMRMIQQPSFAMRSQTREWINSPVTASDDDALRLEYLLCRYEKIDVDGILQRRIAVGVDRKCDPLEHAHLDTGALEFGRDADRFHHAPKRFLARIDSARAKLGKQRSRSQVSRGVIEVAKHERRDLMK